MLWCCHLLSTCVALCWSLELYIISYLWDLISWDNKTFILLFAIALAESPKNCFMNVYMIKKFLIFPKQLPKKMLLKKKKNQNLHSVPTRYISVKQNYEDLHIHRQIECRDLLRHWGHKNEWDVTLPLAEHIAKTLNVNFGSVEQLFFTIPLTHSQPPFSFLLEKEWESSLIQ